MQEYASKSNPHDDVLRDVLDLYPNLHDKFTRDVLKAQLMDRLYNDENEAERLLTVLRTTPGRYGLDWRRINWKGRSVFGYYRIRLQE